MFLKKIITSLVFAAVLLSCLGGCVTERAPASNAASDAAQTTAPSETAATAIVPADYEVPEDSILNQIPKYTYGVLE